MARPQTRQRRPVPVGTILAMALGTVATLGGLVWLALAYGHSGLLAAILPILPVAYGLFTRLLEQSLDDRDDPHAATADAQDTDIEDTSS